MNINKIVDKAYEKKSLKEIADAPLEALQGISENGAKLLNQAMPKAKIKTVRDLANLKYVKWAQAICTLAEGEK